MLDDDACAGLDKSFIAGWVLECPVMFACLLNVTTFLFFVIVPFSVPL